MRLSLLILLLLIPLRLSALDVASGEKALDAKADRLLAAVASGDYGEAEALMSDVLSVSRVNGWEYAPFSRFMSVVAERMESSSLKHANRWAAARGNSPLPYLIRAEYYYRLVFYRHSDESAATFLSEKELRKAYLELAWDNIVKAIRLGDSTPYSTLLFLRMSRYNADTASRENIFKAAIKKFPDYYPLYSAHMTHLSPRAGGSLWKELYFVYGKTAAVPAASPLKWLGPDLYLHLIAETDAECRKFDAVEKTICERKHDDMLKSPSLEAKVKEGLALYAHGDAYWLNDFLLSALECKCYAGSTYAEPMFQLFYDSLGKDNYALNYGRGYYEYNRASHHKALEMLNASLEEAQKASFPSEERKRHTLARIYHLLSHICDALGDKTDAMHYADLAIENNKYESRYYENRCLLDLKTRKGGEESVSDCLKAKQALPPAKQQED